MNYIGNGRYAVMINGQEVVASVEELQEAFVDIINFEDTRAMSYGRVDVPDTNEVWANSLRFEMLRNEIKDSGWENLTWSDEMGQALDIAMECAMKEAHEVFTSQYHMVPKHF